MQENTRRNVNGYQNGAPMDFTEMAGDYLRCLERYWLQLFLLLVIAASVTVAYLNWSYVPSYRAKLTYAVNKTGDTSIDATLARRLSNAVPVIAGTREFTDQLLEWVERDSINMSYTISSQYTEGANLFTIQVTSNNYINANTILDSFQAIYPSWADMSNGAVELQIVDRSEATEIPVNPYSLPELILKGLVLGLVLCAGLATLYVMTIRTVRKESDMKKITSKSCIVRIPEVKVKKREKSKKEQLLISNKRIDWGFKQAILSAQSRIDKQLSKLDKKSVLITSTIPQEGKSVIAVNYALACSQNGKKTVLLDGDLRNPTVAGMLGIDKDTKGLSDYFEEAADLEEIILTKGNLSVIHSGTTRGGASGILSDQRMQELMRYLKEQYDVVIIDTSPAHLFSDAAIFSKYVDEVIYVVRYDLAAAKDIKDGISTFVQSQKLLGYIINRSQGSFSSYGKYGYSRYGRYGKYKRYIHVEEPSMNTEDSL